MRSLVAIVPAVAATWFAARADADACKPLRVDVPDKLEHRTRHDKPIPDIVSYGKHELDAFFEKLAAVARGTPGVTVRIGIYGDSNWTNDHTAGDIRRRLQLAFGDAGHGWVSFGSPWGWYHHVYVRHGLTGTWDSWNMSQKQIRDGLYGFAGASAESRQPGATVWVATAKETDPVGTKVSSFDVHYLARPRGGTFEVLIDKESKGIVDTKLEKGAKPEMRYLHYKVPDGPHKLVIKVKRGRVRLFGVALERDVTGIVLDGLGMNALNPLSMQRLDPALLSQGLTHRNYDLLLETTGTNVWSPLQHKTLMPDLLALFRAALPHAGLMLWSAPDFVKMHREDKPPISEPAMHFLAVQKRKMAETAKISFWDQYEALGGKNSAPKWKKDHWYAPDGVHIGPRISSYVGERFVHALIAELARRAENDPSIGCHLKR